MKKLSLVLFALIFSVTLFAQKQTQPDYYLNSEKIDFNKVQINPQSIDSIRVDKDSPEGKIFIYTKDRTFSYITLADVLKKYTDITDPKTPVLFSFEDRIISDTTGVKIDDTFFIYTKVQNLFDAQYLDEKYHKLVLVDIDLETRQRKPKIVIRGNDDIQLSTKINRHE